MREDPQLLNRLTTGQVQFGGGNARFAVVKVHVDGIPKQLHCARCTSCKLDVRRGRRLRVSLTRIGSGEGEIREDHRGSEGNGNQKLFVAVTLHSRSTEHAQWLIPSPRLLLRTLPLSRKLTLYSSNSRMTYQSIQKGPAHTMSTSKLRITRLGLTTLCAIPSTRTP